MKHARKLMRATSSVSSKSLQAYLSSIDFKVVYADNSTGQTLLRQFELDTLANYHASFAYAEQGVKLVVLQRRVAEKELRFLLLHELGHILCGHNLSCLNLTDEKEANDFATWCLNYKSWSALATVAIMVLGAALTLLIANVAMPVYVTTAGEKYHKEFCFYIRNRDGVMPIKLWKAEQLGYTKCSVCFRIQ